MCLAVQSVPLRQIVLHQLQASLGGSDSAAASLQDTVEACNNSLSAATSLMSEAGTQAAAAWGWPPPETCTGDHSIPARWYQSEHKGRLRNALDKLRLPPMRAQGASRPPYLYRASFAAAVSQTVSSPDDLAEDCMAAAAGQPCLHLDPLPAHEVFAATVVFFSNCTWGFSTMLSKGLLCRLWSRSSRQCWSVRGIPSLHARSLWHTQS